MERVECEYADECRQEGVDCKHDYTVPGANSLEQVCEIRHGRTDKHVIGENHAPKGKDEIDWAEGLD